MGYACPVCGDPQADAGHLANHLAITAMARGGDHEAWLDEHVSDWSEHGEAELADVVADMADGAEYPQVFEDTTGEGKGHEHGQDHGDPHDHEHGADIPVDVADPSAGNDEHIDQATREAIQEARELMADADESDSDPNRGKPDSAGDDPNGDDPNGDDPNGDDPANDRSESETE